jgi:hypothetical protein
MTNPTGRNGKRKSPMEGFNNVPKILEEARRMVDVVAQSEAPDKPAKTTEALKPAAVSAQPASVEPAVKPKKSPAKKTSAPGAAKDKGAVAKKPRAAAAKKPPEVPMTSLGTVPPEKFGISIIHRVPGRTRVKLRQMKYDPVFAKKLEERLAFVPGMIAVETSTITGRAVLYYNPGVVCQPAAFQAWQEAWQDLFPGMQTDQLVADLTSQKLP